MSNPLELGQDILSKQAEIFGHCVRRHGLRVLFAVFALVFLGFAAISFHAVLWMAFLTFCKIGPLYSALCVMGVDLLFVLFFVLLAIQSRSPSVAEERIRFARDQKLHELRGSLALSAVTSLLFGPLGRYAGGRFFSMFRSKKK